MMEVGEPNKNTAHCSLRERTRKKEKQEDECVCVCEFVYNTLLCIFLVLAVCLFRFVIYMVCESERVCVSVRILYIHIGLVYQFYKV